MKTILITGATDGIGFETAKLFAAHDHQLILHGRSQEKMNATLQKIHNAFPDVKIEGVLADLSKFGDVASLLNIVNAKYSSIDVIVNNAGVLKLPNPITENGLDARFVVNTIAPIIITRGLLPILSEQGRIVNLSSAAQSPVQNDAITGKLPLGDDMQAYAQSKLALTMWVRATTNAFGSSQVNVAVNPGSLLASKMVKEGFGVAGNDLSIGAQVLFDAALSNKFRDASGKYFDNDIGAFSEPHPFALIQRNCDELMVAIEKVINEYFTTPA
ncbi:SDR family NAD(P)-dependent oxidoreductase [Glaciecola sp. MH2013]|uniref:SDR family NAD(P)-dependent oxidoreductase n=1 Tax=Glaciecola sp. MH2013 TaxID=2785524 RepID=UPI00189E8476|nr:SDR family NAD(P)-dependent oxidoreductase [Glaciecola sp. MH2013]MBF7073545.1 SDR family NAD(P)-dependent oxidoreductase [Glaciecola sp. MH2013]